MRSWMEHFYWGKHCKAVLVTNCWPLIDGALVVIVGTAWGNSGCWMVLVLSVIVKSSKNNVNEFSGRLVSYIWIQSNRIEIHKHNIHKKFANIQKTGIPKLLQVYMNENFFIRRNVFFSSIMIIEFG